MKATKLLGGAVVVVALAVAGSASSQDAPSDSTPMDRAQIMALMVDSANLVDQTLTKRIIRDGVAFSPTDEDLQAFRGAGADDSLLSAIRTARRVAPGAISRPDDAAVFNHLTRAVQSRRRCIRDVQACEEGEREARAAVAADQQSASAHYALAQFIQFRPLRGDAPTPLERQRIEISMLSVTELREAITLEPTFAEAHKALASCLVTIKDIDGAVAEYREYMRLRPQDTFAHTLLLDAVKDEKGFAAAVTIAKADVASAPDNAAFHFDLSQLYGFHGDVENQVRELREAIRLNPNEPMYHLLYAQAQRDPFAAVPELREALRLVLGRPKVFVGEVSFEAIIRFNLVRALVAQGDLDAAGKECAEIRKLPPDEMVPDAVCDKVEQRMKGRRNR